MSHTASSGVGSCATSVTPNVLASQAPAEFKLTWLDPREFHDFGPLLGFSGDKISEIGRRARKDEATEFGDLGFYFRVGEALVDLLIELVDDIGRRVLGSPEPEPGTGLIARHELAHCRNIGQTLETRRLCYCKRSELTRPDQLDG